MNVDFKIAELDAPEDWAGLIEILGGSSRVVLSIVRHLKSVQTRSYLLETRYIDRDYSADYRRFYAQTFKTYERHCQRIHFFAEDIAPSIGNPVWLKRAEALQATSRRSYRGFCVIRPLPGAPIGRTVLHAVAPGQPGLESVITCRADVRANLLGAELDVVGTSFMQQDSRLGACAQIAIWVGARHMHQRYRYDWLSVADITKLAAPTTPEEATSIPAGSDFLTSERMIRAINEMGFQPLCFEGKSIGASILPYVESGLPVILGMQDGNAGLGHAVTIIGRVFARPKTASDQALDYVPAFIAHDDQAGPYMLVPTTPTSAKAHSLSPDQVIVHALRGKSINFNVQDHGVFAVALMPQRAFSTAGRQRKPHRAAWQRFCRVSTGCGCTFRGYMRP